MAIPDWKLKKEVMRIALGLSRPNDIPDTVVNQKAIDADTFSNLMDNFCYRWHKDKHNLGHRYDGFFTDLATTLACNEVIPGDTLKKCNIVDFIKCLPKATKDKLCDSVAKSGTIDHKYINELKQALEDAGVLNATAERPTASPPISMYWSSNTNCKSFPVWTTTSASSLRLVRQGLVARHIDQSLYYQRPESVDLWYSITNNEFYSGFDQCKTGLIKLTRLKEWKEYVSQTIFDGVVMLGGGGSPSKDVLLIRSLLDNPRAEGGNKAKVKYTLLDTSFFMLTSSREELEHRIDRKKGKDGIKINTVHCDMMSMDGCADHLRAGQGNVVWFLTGGTLGNLNEGQFFDSVAAHAYPDDWLIVGVGCLDETIDANYLADLEREYKQDVVKDLVRVPLDALWSAIDMEGRARDALKSITVKAVVGEINSHSTVRDSVTVIAPVVVDGYGEVILFKSSRYREDALIEFAAEHDWDFVRSVDGLDHTFKQIVFRYRAKK